MKSDNPNRTIAARIKRLIRKALTLLVTVVVFGAVLCSVVNFRGQGLPINRELHRGNSSRAFAPKQPAAYYVPRPSDAPKIQDLALVYAETFDNPLLDPSVWSAVYEYSVANEELQKYHPGQVYIADGYLNITAVNSGQDGYLSGKVDTKDKLELVYGRVDVCMRLCEGTGLFPAIWLFYEDAETNTYVEIDIMENLGQDVETVYGVLHMNTAAGSEYDYSTQTVHNPMDFHVYTVQWTHDSIVWSIDENEYFRVHVNIPAVPMHLIINLAVGGEWAGDPDASTRFPATVQVDYVRIYAPEGNT